jgi:hypothetical protein
LTKLVYDTRCKRSFRSDDSKIGPQVFRDAEVIGGCNDFPESRDAGIARGGADGVTFLRKAPCERMFAASASDDKNLHALITLEQPV